ncbi:hypothetical protein [Streptomyces sp. NPDC058695]|uniref:hypothetical protein n=1 Tax=Streptomyces sp. NPDC058695 TaxID=3346604 RepID=UPI0036516403
MDTARLGVTVGGGGHFDCPVSSDPTLSSGGFTVPCTSQCALIGGSGTLTHTWKHHRNRDGG